LQPTFPILSGQHFYYLYVQLKDFKSGLRKNDIMGPIAAQLDKTQMKLLAKYFSEQNWPNIGFRTSSAAEIQGETATGAGQCVQCHLGGYEGDSRIPRLAGQHPEYLLKTMSDFKHKKRMNSAAKSSLFVSYSEDDIEAMSEYLAGK
jgi:cytochrome c553